MLPSFFILHIFLCLYAELKFRWLVLALLTPTWMLTGPSDTEKGVGNYPTERNTSVFVHLCI